MDNTKRLQKIMDLAGSLMSKEQAEKYFATIIEFVKKLKADLETKNDQAIKELINKLETISQDKISTAGDRFGEFKTVIDKALREQEIGLNYLRDWTRNLKNGRDGKDADEAIVAEKASKIALETLEPKLLGKDDIKEEISKAGDIIVDTLSKQEGEAKLHIEDIYKLQEILDELKQLRTRTLGGGGGLSKSALDSHFVYKEIPTDSGDHLSFTLAHTPSPANSLTVYRSRGVLNLTEDYSLSENVLTLVVAYDSANESLFVDYQR